MKWLHQTSGVSVRPRTWQAVGRSTCVGRVGLFPGHPCPAACRSLLGLKPLGPTRGRYGPETALRAREGIRERELTLANRAGVHQGLNSPTSSPLLPSTPPDAVSHLPSPSHVTSRGRTAAPRAAGCQRRPCDGGGGGAPAAAEARSAEGAVPLLTRPRAPTPWGRTAAGAWPEAVVTAEGAAQPRGPRRGVRHPRRRGCCGGSGSSW